jgi:hypothetical protein
MSQKDYQALNRNLGILLGLAETAGHGNCYETYSDICTVLDDSLVESKASEINLEDILPEEPPERLVPNF